MSISAGISVEPSQAAAGKFSRKQSVASTMRTREWAKTSLALRDKAFFSAGVSNAKLLSQMQRKIQSALDMNGTSFMSRDKFVGDMKTWLEENGYAMNGTSLRDITSNRRLSLVYDFNVEQAREYANWKDGMDPDVLDAFPAQEFFRVENRNIKRDWQKKWNEAKGPISDDGRMIALKTDPVWFKISRFGTPYPPFDFNSGMGIRDIRRKEAVKRGLIEAHETVLPDETMDKYLASVDVSNIPQTLRNKMLDTFTAEGLRVELGKKGELKLINRSVSSRATWSDYGYSSAADWGNTKLSETLNSADAARNALTAGEDVNTPAGKIHYGKNVLDHWKDLGKDEKNIIGRLERYELAKKAAANSKEIWDDEGQLSFLNVYEKPNGKIKGVATVTDKKTLESITYFLGTNFELNKLRHGKRIYSR